MNNPVVYSYKGSEISFMSGNNVMVNATEMAKPFGKQPIDWLKTNQSKDYIETFSKLKFISLADLVQVTKGGNNPGTWMHEDVALEFARWLSPAFSIWCNDRIKELLRAGSYSVERNFPIPQSYSEALLLAANQAKDIENLQQENHQLTSENQKNRPKVDFANCIMQSETCISIGEMANILKQNKLATMGQNQLYQWLRMHTYLLKSGARRNLPSQKSITMGIMRIAEETYDKRTDVIINRKAVITPRGQSYFVDLFKKLSGSSYGLFK